VQLKYVEKCRIFGFAIHIHIENDQLDTIHFPEGLISVFRLQKNTKDLLDYKNYYDQNTFICNSQVKYRLSK